VTDLLRLEKAGYITRPQVRARLKIPSAGEVALSARHENGSDPL